MKAEAGWITVDPAVVPGLLLLVAELLALAAVGYVVARAALRQTDHRLALAQGLVIGPALWGLLVNFMLPVLPGRAGALAGWVVIVTLAAGLACRAPRALRLPPRALAGVSVAALVVCWAALAGRQLLGNTDPAIHLGLAAFMQAGGWPPVIPWIPDQPLFYHYGVDLLISLLAPPFGPDLPFATEVLSAYIWTGFAVTVATLLLRRGGWISVVMLTPLLLTAGAWTLVGFVIPPPDILQIPVPTGPPAAGLRASLVSLYWPEVTLKWQTTYQASPPNIWNPHFVLAYALASVVLERAAASGERTWISHAALALLIGFLGLLSEGIALLTLVLRGALEAVRVLPRMHISSFHIRPGLTAFRRRLESSLDPIKNTASVVTRVDRPWQPLLQAAAGLALAALLLAVGGGTISALLSGTSVAGASFGWIEDPAGRHPFGSLVTTGPGGLAVLGLGVVPIACIALLLAWRRRLVVALVAASGVFLLAALALQYKPYPYDVTRMDGHARNFALLALLVALSGRLSALRPRWRYAAAAVFVALVAWPTVAAPIRMLGLEIGHGIEVANAQPSRTAQRDGEGNSDLMGRYRVKNPVSAPVARFIRAYTAVDARILSPYPHDLTATTGRPNASGFAGLLHIIAKTGPEYADAQRYLEPAAMRRLGVGYVHATDTWIATLPDRARRWLADPALFERLIRADGDALYRVQPAFRALDPAPVASSFEALRRVVPAWATVYLPVAHDPVTRMRLASVLGHTRLLGQLDPSTLHLLTVISTEPLGGRVPDVGVLPRDRLYDVSRHGFTPIWGNEELVAYATRPVSGAAIELPPGPANFAVQMGEVQVRADRVEFSATFRDQASEQWTGQDWLVIEVEDTPWTLPTAYDVDGHTHVGVTWFAGQIVPGGGTVTPSVRIRRPGAAACGAGRRRGDDEGAVVGRGAGARHLRAGGSVAAGVSGGGGNPSAEGGGLRVWGRGVYGL